MAIDGKAMVYVGTWITEDTNLWQALCESGCGWTVLCDSNREFIRHLAIWSAPARPRTGGSAHAGGHACRPPAWAALWRWAARGRRRPPSLSQCRRPGRGRGRGDTGDFSLSGESRSRRTQANLKPEHRAGPRDARPPARGRGRRPRVPVTLAAWLGLGDCAIIMAAAGAAQAESEAPGPPASLQQGWWVEIGLQPRECTLHSVIQ